MLCREGIHLETGGSPSSPTHRAHRRHHHHHHRGVGRHGVGMPVYAQIAIPILLILLFGRLAWQGAHSLFHFGGKGSSTNIARVHTEPPVAPWALDFKQSLDASERDAAAGNLSAAEIAADRAESFLTTARLGAQSAAPGFFASASAQLDRVLQKKPADQRFFAHVTSARIELASFRSAQEIAPPAPADRIVLDAPRPLRANQTLNPAALKGKYLDATSLPEISEILAPPTSRAFADNIRVENLTITGAAQTLDGIRWRNVTFVNTHLRYDGGELSLENVRFIRCRFGLPEDERGARIASAVVLAPPPGAITISEPPAAPTP